MRLTPAQNRFQLWVIFVFLFLVSLLFLFVGIDSALRSVTTDAYVVGVKDTYNSHGDRMPGHQVDYQYFDAQAKIVRRESYRFNRISPAPVVGQTFAVEYQPKLGLSSPLSERNYLGLLCPAISLLTLWSLLVRSARNHNRSRPGATDRSIDIG
jgi:hypothetical protein